jgi:L-cysteine desulfidase
VAAVALAAAWARKALGEDPDRMEITLDRGTYKNGMGVGMAFHSAKLAVQGVIIASHDGILSQSVEETLSNLEHLTHFGMAHADDAILDVMTKEGRYSV